MAVLYVELQATINSVGYYCWTAPHGGAIIDPVHRRKIVSIEYLPQIPRGTGPVTIRVIRNQVDLSLTWEGPPGTIVTWESWEPPTQMPILDFTMEEIEQAREIIDG